MSSDRVHDPHQKRWMSLTLVRKLPAMLGQVPHSHQGNLPKIWLESGRLELLWNDKGS